MRQVFVRELCLLLRKLDITQDAIAAHLHVKRSAVGGWAGGKLSLPTRHEAAFAELVRATMTQTIAQAETQRPPPDASLLTPTVALHVTDMLFTQLRHWELELYETMGDLERDYATYADILKSYLHISPLKLSRKERNALRLASYGLARTLRALAYLDTHSGVADGKTLGWPDDKTPLEYFDRLWTWATTRPDDREEVTDED